MSGVERRDFVKGAMSVLAGLTGAKAAEAVAAPTLPALPPVSPTTIVPTVKLAEEYAALPPVRGWPGRLLPGELAKYGLSPIINEPNSPYGWLHAHTQSMEMTRAMELLQREPLQPMGHSVCWSHEQMLRDRDARIREERTLSKLDAILDRLGEHERKLGCLSNNVVDIENTVSRLDSRSLDDYNPSGSELSNESLHMKLDQLLSTVNDPYSYGLSQLGTKIDNLTTAIGPINDPYNYGLSTAVLPRIQELQDAADLASCNAAEHTRTMEEQLAVITTALNDLQTQMKRLPENVWNHSVTPEAPAVNAWKHAVAPGMPDSWGNSPELRWSVAGSPGRVNGIYRWPSVKPPLRREIMPKLGDHIVTETMGQQVYFGRIVGLTRSATKLWAVCEVELLNGGREHLSLEPLPDYQHSVKQGELVVDANHNVVGIAVRDADADGRVPCLTGMAILASPQDVRQGVSYVGPAGQTGSVGCVGFEGPPGEIGYDGPTGPQGPVGFIGGDPSTQPVTPAEMFAETERMANELLLLTWSEREEKLKELRKANELLYALTIYHLSDRHMGVNRVYVADAVVLQNRNTLHSAISIAKQKLGTKSIHTLQVNDVDVKELGKYLDFKIDGSLSGSAWASAWLDGVKAAFRNEFNIWLDITKRTQGGDLIAGARFIA